MKYMKLHTQNYFKENIFYKYAYTTCDIFGFRKFFYFSFPFFHKHILASNAKFIEKFQKQRQQTVPQPATKKL